MLAFLNHWWNLPFLVMLGLVGVFFVLQAVGFLAHDDVDLDGDGLPDGDADHDLDHDADGTPDASVPFMVVWVTFFIFAGFAGLTFNRVVAARGPYPTWAFAVCLVIAAVIGAIGVRVFSRLAARFVDVGGRGSVRKHELAGKVGTVASAQLDDKFGEVRVRDESGNELLVHGRLATGETPLRHGARLVLIDYDPTKELFWVAAVPELDRSQS
jgi:membrane protein implicated in regulation of membrane protease activity